MSPTKAEQAEATRAKILAVATQMFGDDGYDATSIEGVLGAAGISKGALYHHFKSKEDLFEAVFRAGEETSVTVIANASLKHRNPVAMLRAGCHAWLDLVVDPRMRRIAVVDAPRVLGWDRWRAIDEEYSFGMTKIVLQRAVDEGAIPKQNVDVLAHMMLAMLGEAAMWIARADDPRAARKEAGATIDRMIDALSSPRR